MKRAITALRHIKSELPVMAPLIDSIGPIALPKSEASLEEAVTRIVVGQMLSGRVADVIYARVREAAKADSVDFAWLLCDERLRACGLSGRKIRSLRAFGQSMSGNGSIKTDWPKLPYGELVAAVSNIWGLGEWSASMLAIFHFDHEDVFPMSDGSLIRAIQMLPPDQKTTFEPVKASPFRTYLSLYLWKALDEKLIGPKLNDALTRIDTRSQS